MPRPRARSNGSLPTYSGETLLVDNPMTSSARSEYNLRVLQRHDPSIQAILNTTPSASMYIRDEDMQWQLAPTVGPLFLVERAAHPKYGFCILNAVAVTTHIQPFSPDDDLEIGPEMVIFRAEGKTTSPALGLWVIDSPDKVDMIRWFLRVSICVRLGIDMAEKWKTPAANTLEGLLAGLVASSSRPPLPTSQSQTNLASSQSQSRTLTPSQSHTPSRRQPSAPPITTPSALLNSLFLDSRYAEIDDVVENVMGLIEKGAKWFKGRIRAPTETPWPDDFVVPDTGGAYWGQEPDPRAAPPQPSSQPQAEQEPVEDVTPPLVTPEKGERSRRQRKGKSSKKGTPIPEAPTPPATLPQQHGNVLTGDVLASLLGLPSLGGGALSQPPNGALPSSSVEHALSGGSTPLTARPTPYLRGNSSSLPSSTSPSPSPYEDDSETSYRQSSEEPNYGDRQISVDIFKKQSTPRSQKPQRQGRGAPAPPPAPAVVDEDEDVPVFYGVDSDPLDDRSADTSVELAERISGLELDDTLNMRTNVDQAQRANGKRGERGTPTKRNRRKKDKGQSMDATAAGGVIILKRGEDVPGSGATVPFPSSSQHPLAAVAHVRDDDMFGPVKSNGTGSPAPSPLKNGTPKAVHPQAPHIPRKDPGYIPQNDPATEVSKLSREAAIQSLLDSVDVAGGFVKRREGIEAGGERRRVESDVVVGEKRRDRRGKGKKKEGVVFGEGGEVVGGGLGAAGGLAEPPLPRNEFVRQLLTLIHTDSAFVDELHRDYCKKLR